MTRCVAAVAMLVATAVGLGGCADDDAATGGSGAGATTAAPGAPAPGSGTGSTVGGSSGEDAQGSATTAGGPLDTSGPGTTAAPSDPAAPVAATGPVGSFASQVLAPDRSDRVVIELHVVDGAGPSEATLDHLAGVLGDVSGKPVQVAAGGVPSVDARAWTGAELLAQADDGTVVFQGGGDAVLRLLFVHGTFEGDDSVLGVALRGDVAAVFVDRVEAAGGLLGGSEGIARAVTIHEIGHLLGLVDLVRSTGRADPEHPGHSANPGSVMYWAVESDLVGQLLGADPPADFDAEDRADLAAIAAGG